MRDRCACTKSQSQSPQPKHQEQESLKLSKDVRVLAGNSFIIVGKDREREWGGGGGGRQSRTHACKSEYVIAISLANAERTLCPTQSKDETTSSSRQT